MLRVDTTIHHCGGDSRDDNAGSRDVRSNVLADCAYCHDSDEAGGDGHALARHSG